MSDGEGADAVGPSCRDSVFKAGSEGGLGEPKPCVGDHGARLWRGHDGLNCSVYSTGAELGAVALQVIEPANPISIGFSHRGRMGDMLCDVWRGPGSNKRGASNGLNL